MAAWRTAGCLDGGIIRTWTGLPHLHVHDRHTELIAILAGQVDVVTGERTIGCGGGNSVFVSPGTAHSFVASGDTPAEIAIVGTPPDSPEMIVELGDTSDSAVMAVVLDRYDSRLV